MFALFLTLHKTLVLVDQNTSYSINKDATFSTSFWRPLDNNALKKCSNCCPCVQRQGKPLTLIKLSRVWINHLDCWGIHRKIKIFPYFISSKKHQAGWKYCYHKTGIFYNLRKSEKRQQTATTTKAVFQKQLVPKNNDTKQTVNKCQVLLGSSLAEN